MVASTLSLCYRSVGALSGNTCQTAEDFERWHLREDIRERRLASVRVLWRGQFLTNSQPPRRHATPDFPLGDGFGNHRSTADDRSSADRDAFENHDVGADPNV